MRKRTFDSGPSKNRDDDTIAKLWNSGASLCSSVITIAMAPYFGALKDSSRTLGWKFAGGFLSGVGAFASAWIDGHAAYKKGKSGQYDVATILTIKSMLGAFSGVAFGIDAISVSAPLFKRLAARTGNSVVIGAIEVLTEQIATKMVLRAVAVLTTWEAVFFISVFQFLADRLTPDELESWCSRCMFGTGREAILRLKDHTVAKYVIMKEQEKDFEKAMTRLK